jgi:prepilin-type N-terminal cleavage/methylation domain-containing protein
MHLQKLPLQDKGFTLFEVLISILIVSVFLAVAMQALLFAIIFKVRAEQRQEAITWIQKDLEFVKNQAKEYEINTFPYSNRCNATTSADGFAAGLLHSILGTPTSPPPSAPSTTTSVSKTLAGKSFTLTRTAIYDNPTYAYKLLQLTYNVTPADSNSPIATLSTEVIPDASLKCP